MNSTPQLPEPWRHVRFLADDDFGALESAAGPSLEVAPEELREPTTVAGFWMTARKWALIEDENQLQVMIRLQLDPVALVEQQRLGVFNPGAATFDVSAVVFPFQHDGVIHGTYLRAVPVAEIARAYSEHEREGQANLNRFLHLLDDIEGDPLAPLGRSQPTVEFSARVGRQYEALATKYPGKNITEKLREHNDLSEATAQRWIARARKLGFLAPGRTGRPKK